MNDYSNFTLRKKIIIIHVHISTSSYSLRAKENKN